MSDLNDKLIETITKLIKLTQQNEIKWSSDAPEDYQMRDEDEHVETVFLAPFKNKRLRLYSKTSKYEAEGLLSIAAYGIGKPPKWTTETTLEILDSSSNPIWRFPSLPPLADLLAAVRYQVADVDDFIEDILQR